MSHKPTIQIPRHLTNHISVPTIRIARSSKRYYFINSLLNPVKEPQPLIKIPNILVAQ